MANKLKVWKLLRRKKLQLSIFFFLFLQPQLICFTLGFSKGEASIYEGLRLVRNRCLVNGLNRVNRQH